MSEKYDINYIKNFALNNALIINLSNKNFGETGVLSHDRVKTLADLWLPKIYFHEKELWHPISFNDLLSNRGYEHLDHISVIRQELDEQGNAKSETDTMISPPALIMLEGKKVNLASFTDIRMKNDSYMTIIKYPKEEGTESLKISKKYFGSTKITNGVQMPRLPIKIVVEYKTLLETIKHNLLPEIDDNYPRSNNEILDSVRKDFPLENYIDLNNWNVEDISKIKMIEILDLINFVESPGYNRAEEIKRLKNLGCITQITWDAITKYSILTYYFIYHYNYTNFYGTDYTSYFHEGEVEGCALFFDKSRFNINNLDFSVNDITPDYMISLAHSEYQNLDQIQNLIGKTAADIKNNFLKVWIAVWTHATYMSGPGEIDIIDVLNEGMNSDENITIATLIFSFLFDPGSAIALLMTLKILDDTVGFFDEMSEDGVITGTGDINDPNYCSTDLIVTPLSKDNNIYQNLIDSSTNDSSIRIYPGKWGKDDSPDFTGRTGRFFDKLMKTLNTSY